MSISQKRSVINPSHCSLSISRQCELIGLSRSSFYRSSSYGETSENLKLMELIDEEYTRHPFYGTRKMTVFLQRQGRCINRKRIQRLMRKMGLQSIAPKPGTSRRALGHTIYPYLLRGLTINHPNQVWCSDITYIRLIGGFVYLTVVMD